MLIVTSVNTLVTFLKHAFYPDFTFVKVLNINFYTSKNQTVTIFISI